MVFEASTAGKGHYLLIYFAAYLIMSPIRAEARSRDIIHFLFHQYFKILKKSA